MTRRLVRPRAGNIASLERWRPRFHGARRLPHPPKPNERRPSLPDGGCSRWLAPGAVLLILAAVGLLQPCRPPGVVRTVQPTLTGRAYPYSTILADGTRIDSVAS